VAYTGYVHARGTATPPGEDGRNEIIVSAGGGDVGLKLFETALELRGESRWRNRFWRVLAAGTDIPPRREPGLVVEPNRPDFQGLLARARLSVSQAGYNTVVDLLSSRTRSVLVPFAAEAETEQLVRAGALEARGLARTVLAPRLSAANLGAAIEAVEDVPPPRHRVDLEGATKTTKLVREWLG
jgi:predicted glycosyltransferase